MLNLNRLATLVAVVDTGSFTAAAAALGHTKAMVSLQIKELEAELGVAVLTRSTRRLALTEVGEQFYRDCVRLLREAETAVAHARSGHTTLGGTLRVTSTVEYGNRVVVPALAAFRRRHPGLRVDFVSSSLHADLISERFDVAIRLGTLDDSNHRASLIQSYAILPVAAPAYLQGCGAPSSPDAPGALEWLSHSRLNGPRQWPFKAPDGATATLAVGGAIQADTASALHGFALAGCGVAVLPAWMVGEDLAQGRLQVLFPGYRLPMQGVFALYPNTSHVPAKVRLFIDFIRQFVGAAAAQQAA
ncbi:LysR family transcriptional regulator [Janthinobacterium fluminis]|uniref:LysR family transcriptional regulator n=1 Tax=Janthinobacterium fluminis TaxID=2987524 RepID=A0ABT5K1Q6_9BURK|nr:LysR family transcriptional regulator [Janthinobacterium fluminis]MDC8758917.1 LysR family transcriptional regulator [Janthinobacterium fluminis]